MKPKALRKSSPGFGRCLTRAAVNGLFLVSPSDAVDPAFAANAIRVLGLPGSTLARPRLIAAGADGALHGLVEGIVAAGIQNHQPQLLGRLDHGQDALQRDRFIEGVDVAFQHGIGGNHVVDAVDLDAVAGEINHGDVGIAHLVGEIAQGAAHLGGLEIALELDDGEADALQRGRNRLGIVGGVGEPADMLIGRIAHHQRDALVSECRLAEKPARPDRKNNRPHGAHWEKSKSAICRPYHPSH